MVKRTSRPVEINISLMLILNIRSQSFGLIIRKKSKHHLRSISSRRLLKRRLFYRDIHFDK